MITPDKIQLLRTSLADFRRDAEHKYITEEDRSFMTMVSATVSRLVLALEQQQMEAAKLETLTFSRQLSDTYTQIIESLNTVSRQVTDIRKELIS